MRTSLFEPEYLLKAGDNDEVQVMYLASTHANSRNVFPFHVKLYGNESTRPKFGAMTKPRMTIYYAHLIVYNFGLQGPRAARVASI